MIDILAMIGTSYIVALILVSSPHLASARAYVKKITPYLSNGTLHGVDCRLCVGFWVSLIACAVYGRLNLFLLVYAASYFMATQER